MFSFQSVLKFGAVSVLIGLMAVPVTAATVKCIGHGRQFQIDTTPVSTCAAFGAPGAANISGNSANDPLFGLLGPGLILLDKSDDTSSGTNPHALTITQTTGGLTGAFSFNIAALIASAGKEYYNFVLAFKSGGNFKTQTVWAAFSLADGVSSGDWKIFGRQGLSHVNLYAYERDLPVSNVPLPAAAPLLMAGLGGLLALRRKQKRA